MESTKIKKNGTREEVYNGTALRTTGGLTKESIIFDNGKYKSVKSIERGKNLYESNLNKKNQNNTV